MKTFAIIAVLAASVAAPAFAQTSQEIAAAINNASADNISERVAIRSHGAAAGVSLSSQSGSAASMILSINNASSDRASNQITSATSFANTAPTGVAADIFARFAAADDTN